MSFLEFCKWKIMFCHVRFGVIWSIALCLYETQLYQPTIISVYYPTRTPGRAQFAWPWNVSLVWMITYDGSLHILQVSAAFTRLPKSVFLTEIRGCAIMLMAREKELWPQMKRKLLSGSLSHQLDGSSSSKNVSPNERVQQIRMSFWLLTQWERSSKLYFSSYES